MIFSLSCADLTRASIETKVCFEEMDCPVKPGNDRKKFS